MKRTTLPLLLLCAALLAPGCTQRDWQRRQPASEQPAPATGDSTVYGLACDGSGDSILVFLRDPYDGGDPDTLDILNASKTRQVFGAIRIGDKVAAMRDSANPAQARLVIVTQDLMGQWCYRVKPTLKHGAEAHQLPDSLLRLMEAEREYGFALKVDSVAMPIGLHPSTADDKESLLQYPRLKRYRQWCIHNGQLLLTETSLDSLGNPRATVTDTATLVLLTPDSMVLRFAGSCQGYYRKREEK